MNDEEAAKYTVSYTFGDDAERSLEDVHLSEHADAQGRYYIQFPEVYSYEMGKEVTITVKKDGVQVGGEFTYSVSQYLHNTINKYASSQDPEEVKLRNLCYATLDYGAAAQTYFDGKAYTDESGSVIGRYDTDAAHLVNADTVGTVAVAAQPDDSYRATLEGSITDITGYKAALLLGTTTSIKVFMTGEGADGVTVTCKDNNNVPRTVTSVEAENGKYYFLVTGIRSADLWKTYTITITKNNETATITYSPYTYARNKWNSDEDGIASIVKALVTYGEAAKAMWPNA